ncbi:hypothetical protein KY285_031039 [Solanum tuberosum]|nr:hypothetical protein KY285_031039 [Solanum tuberosum]
MGDQTDGVIPPGGLGNRPLMQPILEKRCPAFSFCENKVGFFTSDCVKPNMPSPELRQWKRCDDMVTSLILNTLSREIADSVEYASNSVELWKELEERYDQTNGAKLYQIQKEINDMAQGNLDITTYYTRLKKLWEELCTLNAKTHFTCVCTCGAKDNLHKAEQERRLIHFLMGLNEVYTVVRGSILMVNPLPSMAHAFSTLSQEENRREFKPTNQFIMESTSVIAGSSGASSYKTFKTNYSPNIYPPRPNYSPGSSSSSHSGRRPMCEYCKRQGHTKDKCYKLHGYPTGPQYNTNTQSYNNQNYQNYNSGQGHNQHQSYRFNKGKGKVANVHG